MLEPVPCQHLFNQTKSLFKIISLNNNLFIQNSYLDGKKDIPVHVSECFMLDDMANELLSKDECLIESQVHYLTNIIGKEIHFNSDVPVNWYFAYYRPNETCSFPIKLKDTQQCLEQFQVYTMRSNALKLILENEAVMGCHLLLITSSNNDKDVQNIDIKYVS